MNQPGVREAFSEALFGFSEKNGVRRSQWILIFIGIVWIILSGLDILVHFISSDQRHIAIVIMSFAKYLPLLIVPYIYARRAAASYLTDIFELDDPGIAERFITYVAFGTGSEKLTIDDGRVNPSDLNSAILLIGGPGVVQVNLNNVAVAEKPNGEPHILYAQPKRWRMEGFERIREIEVEGDMPKYAIISLKDQFIQNLSLATRTKDGIMIEAQDIKIIFSVRKSEDSDGINEVYNVSEDAVYSVIYKQTVLVGASKSFQPRVGFPWDSTILPLVFSEIEDIIRKHTLGEILASIGQKELDQTLEADQEINTLKSEITGQQRPVPRLAEMPEFQSRSKITARFYEREFIEKAEKLGVQLLWIDIGTWKLPSTLILNKHKEAWNLSRENGQKRASIQRKKATAIRNEIMRLINEVILSRFEEATSIRNIPLSTGAGSIAFRRHTEKKPEEVAKDILRAFRKELLAALDLFLNDVEDLDKNRDTVESIQNAIKEINYYTDSHLVK